MKAIKQTNASISFQCWRDCDRATVSEGFSTGQWIQNSAVWHQPRHLHRSLSFLSSPWALALCNLKRTIYHLFKVAMALSLSLSFCSSLSLSIILFSLNTHISIQSHPKTQGLVVFHLETAASILTQDPLWRWHQRQVSRVSIVWLGLRKSPFWRSSAVSLTDVKGQSLSFQVAVL